MNESRKELIFVATKVNKATHKKLRIEAAKNDLPLKGYIRKVLEEVTNDVQRRKDTSSGTEIS
jgi:predicted HicB family RNase H-like nuclease